MFFQGNISFILMFTILMAVTWVYINHKVFIDFFSPFNVLLFVWVLPFMASYLHLSELQLGLSSYAELLIIGCTVIAAGISLLFRFVIAGKKPTIAFNGETKTPWANMIIIISLIIVCLAKYFSEFSTQGIPLLQSLDGSATSHIAHRFGKDSALQVIAIAMMPIGIIGYFLALQTPSFTKKLIWLCIAGLPILLGILKMSKSDVFEPFFYYFVLTYYSNQHKSGWLRKYYFLPVIAALTLVLAISMTMLRMSGTSGGISGGTTISYADAIEFKESDAFLGQRAAISILYGYTSMGFENFSRYIDANDNSEPLRLGTSMFRPLLSALKQGNIADEMLVGIKLNEMHPAANVGTYLRSLYIEGGWLMCIIATIVYTFFVNLIYVNFRRSRTPLTLIFYVMLLFPWSWLFFTNAFSVLTTYLNLIYILLLYHLCFRKDDSNAYTYNLSQGKVLLNGSY